MLLATGTRLGPHEIHSAIGAGGMGEVYKATDTNLEARSRHQGIAGIAGVRSRSVSAIPSAKPKSSRRCDPTSICMQRAGLVTDIKFQSRRTRDRP